jgi:hypothetical protein
MGAPCLFICKAGRAAAPAGVSRIKADFCGNFYARGHAGNRAFSGAGNAANLPDPDRKF